MPPQQTQDPQNLQVNPHPSQGQAFGQNPQVPQQQGQKIDPNQLRASLGHATALLQQTLPPPQNKPQETPQEPDQGGGDQKLQQMMQMIAEEFKKQKAETAQMIQDAVGGLRGDIATAIAEEDKKENGKT